MALSLALISACGAGEPTGTVSVSTEASETTEDLDEVEIEPWGEQAVAWWDAMSDAARQGVEYLVPFLASDLVWEDRVFDRVTNTEWEWVEFQLAPHRGSYLWIDPVMLVSADELLGSFTVLVPNGELLDGLDRMVIGPDGVSHWVTGLGPLEACRAYMPWMLESDIDGLVDRYLAFWGRASDVEVGSLYAPHAAVSDSLLGVRVSGSDAIAETLGSGTWLTFGSATVPTISAEWGRAVIHVSRYYDWVDGPEEIRFLIDTDDGSGCPGRIGVALALEDERVIWEHRYHDIESVRRCYDPSDLQPGWWEGMVIPETQVKRQTGTVSVGDMVIDVFNGTPELDEFIRWGFSRFEQAGLSAPRVDSVTFIRGNGDCQGIAGRASISAQETRIILCFRRGEICADEACTSWSQPSRHYLLHELAHPWLAEFTDEEMRSRFLDLFALPRWSDLDDPWRQRGVERAAEVLMHSLMDETVTLFPQIHESCRMRDSGFEMLTGSVPLASCVDASQ